MTRIKDAAAEFLSHRRFAVVGVSRNPAGHGSNAMYLRLKERGYEVFAVNPAADTVEGDPCYASVAAIPARVDGVFIGTRPDHVQAVVEEAHSVGITRVWMHRAFGEGSVDDAAVAWGRERGMTVIDGGCPLMFGPPSDGGHRFMCAMLQMTGKVPRTV